MIHILIWEGVEREKFGLAVFTNDPDLLSWDSI